MATSALFLAVVGWLASASIAVAQDDTEVCGAGLRAAAELNAVSLARMAWAPFGRPETGWAIYEPMVAGEVSTACAASTPAFAAHVAIWQRAHGLAGAGVVDLATLTLMKSIWQSRRPFVAASRLACPAPPDEAALARADAAESYGGKVILLRPSVLSAYRRMVDAARAELPAVRADGRLLTIFSGYRSPAYDDARCHRELNCQGVVRATCSAHRTGLAFDLFLGAAPGFPPDSSADANRLFIARGPAYRWLVRKAARFGFVNYVFEPWHWEFVHERP